jgi:anti-sigma factor RsiW
MTEQKPITCQEFIETLDDYVAGDMPDKQRSAAVVHLEGCRSCVAYEQSYRRTIELEKQLTRDDLRATLPVELAREIERQRKI